MSPEDVVRELWARIEARNWTGLRALLGDQLVVEWPVTGEIFRGPDNFVAVQRSYPEGWTVRLLRVVADGDQVVAEVEVPHQHVGVFRNAMFATVGDGKLLRATEYWTQLDSEPAPEWRARYRSQPG